MTIILSFKAKAWEIKTFDVTPKIEAEIVLLGISPLLVIMPETLNLLLVSLLPQSQY